MSLGNLVSAALPGLRAEAESLMLDYGKALHPTGGYEYDSVDTADVLATEDMFSSRCKIQSRDLVARSSEVGGRTVTSIRVELHLPASTDPLAVGDVWEMTAVSDSSFQTVGQRFRVIGTAPGTVKTARRYEVEETA